MSGPVSCSLSWNWLLDLKTTYNSPTYACTTYGWTCPILFSLDSNVIQKCQGDEARKGRANASSLYDTLIAEEFLLNTTAQAEFQASTEARMSRGLPPLFSQFSSDLICVSRFTRGSNDSSVTSTSLRGGNILGSGTYGQSMPRISIK